MSNIHEIITSYYGGKYFIKFISNKAQKKVLTPLPYWVSIDFGTKVINFIPVSKESLETLQYVFYTFSTKVNTSKLNNASINKTSDMVVDELVSKGHLDSNLLRSKSLNIDKGLLINPSFNKIVIKNILTYSIIMKDIMN